MIVLPNSFERYINNLRIYASLSVLKRGLLPRHLVNLKKIYLAEAFLYNNIKESVNIELLSFNLLCCVRSVKEFGFKTKVYKNVLINKKLYTALILLLAANSHYLTVKFKDGIIIKGKGEIKNSLKVIKYLDGFSLLDLKTMEYLIYIPAEETDLSPTPTVTQWELIFDKFSEFHLFL